MKELLIACSLLGCGASSFAQTAAQAMFFELGGPGIASINYDMRFSKSEKGLGGRVGIGSKSERGTAIFIPLGINYIMTKDDRKYFE